MNEPASTGLCPACGAELPATAPQGLCPRCLLLGVAAPTDPGDDPGGTKPWLTGQSSEQTQTDAARQLGLSDGAMRVRIHRLRRRFRALVKAEIAQTVQDPAEAGDELRHLIAVWGAARGA